MYLFVFIIIQQIDKEIKAEIDEAVKKSKADSEIPLSELAGDIYSKPLETTVRGVSPFQKLEHVRIGPAVNLN